MSGYSDEERMDAYLRERANRPFGDTELESGRALAPFSEAALTAAENLLAKADRALCDGDRQRAERFIGRAVEMKYDEHEQTAPAAFAASMMLFNEVTDALECSAEGDTRWLDAAVMALSSASGWGRSEMQHALLVIRAEYDIARDERRTIDAVVGTTPERVELTDAELAPEALAGAVTSVLEVLQAYRAASWPAQD